VHAANERARRKEMAPFSLRIAQPHFSTPSSRRTLRILSSAILSLTATLLFLCMPGGTAVAQVEFTFTDTARAIVIHAASGYRWEAGGYEVWLLQGDCLLEQGRGYARAREAVLWIDRRSDAERRKVIAYLEGNVEILPDRNRPATRLSDQSWFGRFYSSSDVEVRAAGVSGKPNVLPPIYWEAMKHRNPEPRCSAWQPPIRQANYAATNGGSNSVVAAPPPGQPVAGLGDITPMPSAGMRRIRVFPRSDVPVQAQWFPDPASRQWIAVIESGVNVIVDGVEQYGTLDISADRLVIWTTATEEPDLTGRTRQDPRTPLEFYMEGNIVFRQGERVIHAERMYYDVPNQVGTVINAEMLTPVKSYEGLLRLRAEIIEQTAANRFFAKDAYVTSSRMGEPKYRLQAGNLYFEDIEQPLMDPVSGRPLIDPLTGQPVVEHQKLATAEHNFLFLGPVPVFYWPKLATDLNDPTYYIRRARLKQDNVYGLQILTNWNGYELLGIRNKPVGTDLDITLDYLGDRGFGHGGAFSYDREGFFGIPGQTAGLLDYWGIQDHGADNLGRDRTNVPPETSYRNRLFWQHRQLLPYDLQLSAELGWISDRNFLEEYYKGEWEELKDQTTGVELKRSIENRSWSISVDYGLNDFFTHTDWLPRADHFWLGQPLFQEVFTWFEHSHVGYAQFRRLTLPADPAIDGPFNYLPWEQYAVHGERLATRQEIDWPFQLGPIKVVPYALGEAAHWGQAQDGEPLDRLFWQAGVRASLPLWAVNPAFESELFNVHGLAHKIVFDAEFSYADANRDLEDLPLYDPLDDDSVEAFRRRFMTSTFGVPSLITVPPGPAPAPTLIPPQFDERFYAVRTGLQNWVTSPSTEIADDLVAVRLGAKQRWQTKRGPPANRRIIDWMILDTNMTFFPDADRDNFGQLLGLLDYDYRWHVGDRLTLVSDGIFDFFSDGQQVITVGGFLSRPPRGSLYAGFRLLEGPIHNKILSFSYSYWMSPKWISTFGTTIDLGREGNIGQNFSITRIGESFLVSAGFTVDAARDSIGVALAVEPRFLPRSRLGNQGGAQIPPAGAFGLE